MPCRAVPCTAMPCHTMSCHAMYANISALDCAVQWQAEWQQWLLLLCCMSPLQALPPNDQPLSTASASTLSKWICEGPKGKDAGIDSKLDGLLPPSHSMILWAAAVCRVVKVNVFANDLAGEYGHAMVVFPGLPGGAGSHRLATHSAIRRTRLPGSEAKPHQRDTPSTPIPGGAQCPDQKLGS
jgi:hypothetical protein